MATIKEALAAVDDATDSDVSLLLDVLSNRTVGYTGDMPAKGSFVVLDVGSIPAQLLQNLTQRDRAIITKAQSASGATAGSGLTYDLIQKLLLENFKTPLMQKLARPSPLNRRRGPVEPTDGIVPELGQCFPLVGFNAIVDDVIRLLIHMCRKFRRGNRGFKLGLQLLRFVGAPGTGKSTALQSVWWLIKGRLAEVEAENGGLWQHWKSLGVEQLQERLASWMRVPLVFNLDMNEFSHKQHFFEVDPASSLALRMLFAAAAGEHESYEHFHWLLNKIHPELPTALAPQDVLVFLHAALPAAGQMSPMLAVWCIDEVNVFPARNDKQPTFMQELLSAAVLLRSQALKHLEAGRMDLLPVFVTGSTRGTASSLQYTASGKPKMTDVVLAVPTEQQKCLMVMDLFRRLPLPDDLRTRLQLPDRSRPFEQLEAFETSQLLRVCPRVLSQVLRWMGGFFRLSEHAVACMSGFINEENSRNLNVESVVGLLTDTTSITVKDVVNSVAYHQFLHRWSTYLGPEQSPGVRHKLMQAVFAHALTGKPVARTTNLLEAAGHKATVQDLESDGMILLVPAGGHWPVAVSRSTSHDSHDSTPGAAVQPTDPGTDPVEQQQTQLALQTVQLLEEPEEPQTAASALSSAVQLKNTAAGAVGQLPEGQQAASTADEVADQPQHSSMQLDSAADLGVSNPDSLEEWSITVPGILLIAMHNRLWSASQQAYVTIPLLKGLADRWRDREQTDLATLALRLQSHLVGFNESSVLLTQLVRSFAGTPCDTRVLVPTSGYAAVQHPGAVDLGKFRESVMNATAEAGWMHLGPGNNGPTDSWMVLLECDQQQQPTGRRIVISMQSKAGKQSKKLTPYQLAIEQGKVPMLGAGVLQAFIYLSDQEASNAKKRKLEVTPSGVTTRAQQRRRESARQDDITVIVLLRSEQHLFRAATQVVKSLNEASLSYDPNVRPRHMVAF